MSRSIPEEEANPSPPCRNQFSFCCSLLALVRASARACERHTSQEPSQRARKRATAPRRVSVRAHANRASNSFLSGFLCESAGAYGVAYDDDSVDEEDGVEGRGKVEIECRDETEKRQAGRSRWEQQEAARGALREGADCHHERPVRAGGRVLPGHRVPGAEVRSSSRSKG